MKKICLIFIVALISLLCACADGSEIGLNLVSTEKRETLSHAYEAPSVGEYDSRDTSIITKISTVNKTITFYNYSLRKSYTLSYDGVTRFADKYDTAKSVNQLQEGSVVEIWFLKSDKLLVKLKEDPNSFKESAITGFSVNASTKIFEYKGDSYKITNSTILVGDEEITSFADLCAADEVTIYGYDNTIYSIAIDKGHGYLTLKGADYFEDGLIETDDKNVEIIKPNMKLMLTEGAVTVKISKNETKVTKQVEIIAGKETELDLSDVEIVETLRGRILFDVDPQSAAIYVDGNPVDTSKLLTLDYGLHQLVASAEGHDSLIRYFNVSEQSFTLPVKLESKAADKESGEDSKQEDKEPTYIIVSLPSNVEVYFDGIYMGTSPVTFAKKPGTHVLELKKTGYVSRSYTIYLEDNSENVYYSFDDLAIDMSVSTSIVTQNPDEIPREE